MEEHDLDRLYQVVHLEQLRKERGEAIRACISTAVSMVIAALVVFLVVTNIKALERTGIGGLFYIIATFAVGVFLNSIETLVKNIRRANEARKAFLHMRDSLLKI
jgi:hypothetical protein